MATGLPISYVPHAEHNRGVDPIPGLMRRLHDDGTADIVVFPEHQATPDHFERVPRGDATPHTWRFA